MKPLDLSPQEQELLVQVLERCLGDLDHEIRHTDHGEFKRILRRRQAAIAVIIQKLPAILEHADAA
jgi:hypothetical protein